MPFTMLDYLRRTVAERIYVVALPTTPTSNKTPSHIPPLWDVFSYLCYFFKSRLCRYFNPIYCSAFSLIFLRNVSGGVGRVWMWLCGSGIICSKSDMSECKCVFVCVGLNAVCVYVFSFVYSKFFNRFFHLPNSSKISHYKLFFFRRGFSSVFPWKKKKKKETRTQEYKRRKTLKGMNKL